jgi:hypothetical protein
MTLPSKWAQIFIVSNLLQYASTLPPDAASDRNRDRLK